MQREGGHMNKEALEQEARELATALIPGETARILALSGDLGSGKTTFVQSLARALGVSEHITSPTFVIQKRYPLSGQQFDALIHIDAYRLEGADDLEKLDWDEIASNPNNLIVIEWAERIKELLPPDTINLSLAFLDEHTRSLFYPGSETSANASRST